MILKKPYAFLIKRFRLIHLILTIFIAYLLVSTYKIYSFFARYVSNVYATLSDAIPSNYYISLFMFLTIIIIVTFSLAMYLLMKRKEKPRLLYVELSSYYVILLGSLIAYFMLFKRIETGSFALSIKTAMVIRDVTLIMMVPQVLFFFASLIRGVGFDIKKFNFTKDLKELDIRESDNEEFEFVLGAENYKYARFIRRRIREFKYYILENKFMFTILASLSAFVLFMVVVLNFTVYNRKYSVSQKVVANNLSIQINNSYLTNIDYTGNKISNDKYFLVVNTTFINNSGVTTVLNLTSYELKTKEGTVHPTLSRNNYFVDLGAGYAKEKIENGNNATYILVYELKKSQLDKKYTLRIIDEVEYKIGSINSKTKDIILKPKSYTEIENVGTFKLGTPVTMYDSILNNSSLLVDEIEFMNKFTYNYESCSRGNCTNKTDVVVADATKDKTLLVLDGSLVIDNNSTFARNLKKAISFFDAFVQIKYDDKLISVKDVTPKSLVDEYIIEVDSQVKKANNVLLIITVRNKRYTIKLK